MNNIADAHEGAACPEAEMPLADEVQALVGDEEAPEVVEIRMDYTKDTVQVARGGGCSWK